MKIRAEALRVIQVQWRAIELNFKWSIITRSRAKLIGYLKMVEIFMLKRHGCAYAQHTLSCMFLVSSLESSVLTIT